MAKHSPLRHWQRTRLLAVAVVSTWAIVTVFLPFFTSVANGTLINPIASYVFAAEGVLLLIVALGFWFARRQRGIDREYALAEED